MAIKSIYLHGSLKKYSSQPIELDVSSIRHIISAMVSYYGVEFRKEIFKGEWEITSNGSDIGSDMLDMHIGGNEIHIRPALQGAGNGRAIGKIIVGIALIAITAGAAAPAVGGAAAASGGAAAAGAGVAGGFTAAGFATSLGYSLVLGGLSSLLSPTPGGSDFQSANDQPSFLFNGAANVMSQGGPVPLCYGKFMCISTVISSGIDIEEIPLS